MNSIVEILNVGEGDIKISFDKDNPAERIRAARIVKDMLRRGYVLIMETEPGSGEYTRVLEFLEDTCEYVIVDFDPTTVSTDDEEEPKAAEKPKTKRLGRPPGKKRVPADKSKVVAVSKTAGG